MCIYIEKLSFLKTSLERGEISRSPGIYKLPTDYGTVQSWFSIIGVGRLWTFPYGVRFVGLGPRVKRMRW